MHFVKSASEYVLPFWQDWETKHCYKLLAKEKAREIVCMNVMYQKPVVQGECKFQEFKNKATAAPVFPSATTYVMQNRRKNWAKVHPFFLQTVLHVPTAATASWQSHVENIFKG